MASGSLFVFEHPPHARRARLVLRRLPALAGPLIRIQYRPGLRDGHGPVHAGSFMRERRIALNCRHREFARVFVHEVFHFVWFRLGNPRRRSFGQMLRREMCMGAGGELGWSAEWRKNALRREDVRNGTRRWREYCCESFCDSAAWLLSGTRRHEEFTLRSRFREKRRRWFTHLLDGPLSI